MLKKGSIDTSALLINPEKHELMTASYFADMGKNIVFIRPSNLPEIYRPDIIMDGVEWEIKSPIGNVRKSIIRNFQKAAKQSRYIIFDLRRIALDEKQCISILEREFEARKHVRKLLVICKDETLLKYEKGS